MPCYSPLTAYQCGNGEVIFSEHKSNDVRRTLTLPCGQCIGCKLERARQWAVRCTHEATLHENNCFVTLTYDDEHLPYRGQLQHSDFQKFMKRLRKHTGPDRVRFYMGGEYGSQNWRPHYHACLFGIDWQDKRVYSETKQGHTLYESDTLTRLWGMGLCTSGAITFDSAGYIARYCTSKITGDMAENWYKRRDDEGEYQLTPEYSKMSLKPGIGAGWLDKYTSDVYTHDYVIINGKETKPPKYYDKLLDRTNPDRYEELKGERELRALENWQDNTPERLAVKEKVTHAAIRQLERNL